MSEARLYELSLFVGVIGLLIALSLGYIGWRLFRLEADRTRASVIDIMHLAQQPWEPNTVTAIIDEYFSRRNEFWTLVGQLAVSILVVVIVAILLLAKIITPDAGLPILSGVGGFAIGKGVQTGRTVTAGRTRREQ